METNKDKETIISSIKNIYSNMSVPVVLCDKNFVNIWKNSQADKILNKINLDLVLSDENLKDISKFVKYNKHGVINACFLPFLGCKIDVIPVVFNKFAGIILMFETSEDDNSSLLFNNTDNIVSILSSNLRLPMHIINNIINVLNNDINNINSPDKEKLKKSVEAIENNTYKMYRICTNLSELIRFLLIAILLTKQMLKSLIILIILLIVVQLI